MSRVSGLGWSYMDELEPLTWWAASEVFEEASVSRLAALRLVVEQMIDSLRHHGHDPRVLMDRYSWSAEYDFQRHAIAIRGTAPSRPCPLDPGSYLSP